MSLIRCTGVLSAFLTSFNNCSHVASLLQIYNVISLHTNSSILQVFEEDALAWEDKLNRINSLFDVWIDVQRRWVYLDGIFSGSADIPHLLPVETSRFAR